LLFLYFLKVLYTHQCWRRHEAVHPLDNEGVVLAATAGAVNVRLGEEMEDADEIKQSVNDPKQYLVIFPKMVGRAHAVAWVEKRGGVLVGQTDGIAELLGPR
jgi:cobalamin biosynthesis protein CobD/CbiB